MASNRTTIAFRANENQLKKLDFLVVKFRNEGLISSLSRQSAIAFLIEGKHAYEMKSDQEI